MHRFKALTIVVLALLATIFPSTPVCAQQPQEQAKETETPANALEPIYLADMDVSVPALKSAARISLEEMDCKDMKTMTAVFELLIDKTGHPKRIYAASTPNLELLKIARKLVEQDQFIPAMHNGEPVVSANQLSIQFQYCPSKVKVDTSSSKQLSLTLAKIPTQSITVLTSLPDEFKIKVDTIGGSTHAPTLLHMENAEFSDEARRANVQGTVLIQLIVDANGLPVNPHIIRSLGYGLDEQALRAVRKYRFKPAYRDGGTTVPVVINVEVNFRFYERY